MAEIRQTERTNGVLKRTWAVCTEYRQEFVMPEHLLMALTDEENFAQTFSHFASLQSLVERLEEKLDT